MLARGVLLRGAVGSVLVLGGGLVAAILPASTPILQYETVAALRASETVRLAALVAILLGIGLLAAAWLSLCRWAARQPAARQDDAIASVRVATVLWVAPLVLAPPLFSRDAWSYAAQGAVAAAGFSPYDYGPGVLSGPIVEAVDPLWMWTPAPYGPLPLFYAELMADHTLNPLVLAIGHRLIGLVGLVLLAWAVPRLAAWCGARPALASALVVASPFVMTNGVAGVHNDLLMVGLMAAALVVAVQRGWWAGAVIGGLAAAVKVPGGLVCLAVVLVSLAPGVGIGRRVGRAVQVAVVAGLTLVALGFVTGFGLGWVHALGVPGIVETPLSVLTQLSRLVRDTGVEGAVRGAGTIVALGVAVGVGLRTRTGSVPAATVAIAAVTGVLVVLSPVVHVWYLLWPLPFAAVLPLRRAFAWMLVGGSVTVALVSPLEPSLRHDARAIWVSTALAVALIAVLLHGPGRRLVGALVELDRPVRLRRDDGATVDQIAVQRQHLGDRAGPREPLGSSPRGLPSRSDGA